jgi:hypothetical protein
VNRPIVTGNAANDRGDPYFAGVAPLLRGLVDSCAVRRMCSLGSKSQMRLGFWLNRNTKLPVLAQSDNNENSPSLPIYRAMFVLIYGGVQVAPPPQLSGMLPSMMTLVCGTNLCAKSPPPSDDAWLLTIAVAVIVNIPLGE